MKLIRECIGTYSETYELDLDEAFLVELNKRLAEDYEMKSNVTLSDVVDVLEDRYNPALDVEGAVIYLGHPITLRVLLDDIINTKVWQSEPYLEFLRIDEIDNTLVMDEQKEAKYREQEDEDEEEDEEK